MKARRLTADGQPKPHIKLAPKHWWTMDGRAWHAQVGIHNAVGYSPTNAYFHLMAFIRPKERPLVRCASNRDGDCSHRLCPQLRDGEPIKSGRHCPIDIRAEEE